jgi:hypothetical protein
MLGEDDPRGRKRTPILAPQHLLHHVCKRIGVPS